ncbi:hypothetical protein ACPPVO_40440 [Dactylosporangium sp. McL0621]
MRRHAPILAGFIVGLALLAFGVLWLLAFVPGMAVAAVLTLTIARRVKYE